MDKHKSMTTKEVNYWPDWNAQNEEYIEFMLVYCTSFFPKIKGHFKNGIIGISTYIGWVLSGEVDIFL